MLYKSLLSVEIQLLHQAIIYLLNKV